jgi:hypothetical protein
VVVNDDDHDDTPDGDNEEQVEPDEDVGANIASDEDEGANGASDEDEGANVAFDEDEGANGASDEDGGANDAFDEDAQADDDVVDVPDEQQDDLEELQPIEEGTAPETTEGDCGHAPDQRAGEQTRRNLRTNRERNYDHRLGHIMDDPASNKSYDAQFLQLDERGAPTLREAVEEMQRTGEKESVMNCLTGIIMTQMSAKAGIKKHGQVAVDALFEEFSQLHDLGVFLGQDANKLTRTEKKASLRAISVIKEKRCGRIKGRTVADGRPQRQLYTKEETSSPTVSSDALMMSLLIDANEGRDVATAVVAGAYLHAELDDFTLLRMEGESVDIMCDVSEEYRNFVCYENGKKVLYLKLLKALYGCVKSALLWYELFSSTLEGMGFVLNPYDTCVANKTIDGKQCTIAWYVDDNKISHVEDGVVTQVIEAIEARFGKMTVTRGKRHVFLGMDITFHDDGTVSVNMKDYIMEAIAAFGEDITRTAATPAKKDCFEINDKSEALTNERSEVFHSIVAKLLYVSKRSRLDIQLAIAFLCTRVSCSTNQDWAKLRRVLEYLQGTLDEFLTLGADDIGMMKTWVDASYAVHKDMKSHTGGVVSFGRGAVMSKSSKQKLNTKSSTEAELVGASDYLPYPIWAKKFLEAQGYSLTDNAFYQDNQSTIRFERNGRRSCGPNSRHIDIRYFFIKDRINLEGLDVRYCPTEQMLADFFTKPLQGSLFRKFRAVVLGHEHIDSLKSNAGSPSPSQERVGTDIPGNGGRQTDRGSREPLKTARNSTYAEIVKGEKGGSPLTLRK